MADEEIPTVRDVCVGNVMTEVVETIPADSTAAAAAERLFESDIGSLLVGADAGPPEGIVTESDFVYLAATERDPTTVTVADCMSSPVITVSTSTTIEDAAELMAEENIKKLPVIEQESGKVAGVITTTDIAKYLPIHEFYPEK